MSGRTLCGLLADIENLDLVFSHSFTTALGVDGSNVETVISSKDGSNSKSFQEGNPVRIRLSELLDMAGIDLDDRNDNSGGAPPADGMKWPIYRMTGTQQAQIYIIFIFNIVFINDFGHFRYFFTNGMWPRLQ